MSTVKRQSFLRGVVEGFYGRPWTTEQRLDLFSRLGRWGMNCYLYAPKDDDKHRAIWRELYTLEEADHLSMLIQEARHRGIQLIYAIAPGLDITFSSEKEMEILKRKLSQIEALGCQSFALLFDDIDPDLSTTDAKVFSSSAHAQAAVANDVYAHLKSPESFLFCPTEYCGSRAVPNVTSSQYLEVLGETLHQNIDILWTGPKVISKSISVASIQELTKVLRRPPILWDNLHANDYDQRCLFLGPYQGRSTSLIPMLNGVLTNPNCEYTANFIPIHTLAQWCRSQVVKQQRHSSATVATVQLEKENTDEDEMSTAEASSSADCKMDVLLYNDKEALEIALKEWIVEFSANRRKVEDYLPPKTSKSVAVAVEADAGLTRMEGTQMEEDRNDPGKVRSGSGSSAASEMDTTPICLEESEPLSLELTSPTKSSHSAQEPFMLDDLRIMVDFFYLPHQNGERALKLLQEFCWLKKSAPGYDLLRSYRSSDSSGSDLEEASNKPTKGARAVKLKLSRESDGEEVEDVPRSGEQTEEAKVTEWLERAADLHAACEEISQCFNRLTAIPNRPLLYDLYSYMSDARETAMQLDSYVSWLEAGGMEVDPKNQPLAPHGGIVAQMLHVIHNSCPDSFIGEMDTLF